MAATELVDDDTLAAVVKLWTDDPYKLLASVFKQPAQAGELKAGQQSPYAQLQCEPGKASERMTGGVRHDYRKVTISVEGSKPDVVSGASAVLGTFNLKLGSPGAPALTYPSAARFMQCWPLNDGKMEDTKTKKDGVDWWKATVELQIWSIRTDT